jgi:hypothetical protein
VYFKAELGGSTILQETPAAGRAPGRENAGPCLCVHLCTDTVVVGDPETVPHWQQVEVFDIHPTPGTMGAEFLVEGYAGTAAQAFVFGGGVTLKGNCPLRNIATGNPLEYRFTIGEWTWSPAGDNPAVMPSVAPLAQVPVTQIQSTHVGYVFYTDGNGMAQSHPVEVAATDDADGWIQLQSRPVTVPMYNPPGSTAVVNVDQSNFIRTFDLLVLNSPAITALHPAKMPVPLPKADAGRSLVTAEKEPIRRYRLRFEVRDSVTLAALPGDTLDSIILDNSPVIVALNLVELQANACNPLGGAAQAHVQYTLDHPHLRHFDVTIANNSGTVHPPPAHSGSPTVAMPSGDFSAGSFFFRGGASGTGGVASSGIHSWRGRRPPAPRMCRRRLRCCARRRMMERVEGADDPAMVLRCGAPRAGRGRRGDGGAPGVTGASRARDRRRHDRADQRGAGEAAPDRHARAGNGGVLLARGRPRPAAPASRGCRGGARARPAARRPRRLRQAASLRLAPGQQRQRAARA